MIYCIHRRVLLVALAAAPFLLAGEAFATDYVEEAVDPVLTLVGNSEMTVPKHRTFTDPGAICTGKHVNEAGHKTVMGTPAVWTYVVGTHTLTYTCTDTRGVSADPVTRKVTVKPATKPVLTLNGDANVEVELPGPDTPQVRNSAYTDPGATCTGENIPGGSKTVYADVTNMRLGSNTLTYYCHIPASYSADPVTRTVTIVATPPTLTLNGPADAVHRGVQSNWRDLGATCTGQFIDGGSTTVYSAYRTLHPELIGKYTLTYACTDSRGVSANSVTGTVFIYGKPLHIELLGGSAVTITQGESWTDPGARCKNGGFSYAWRVYTDDSMDTEKVGTYTLNYKCKDYFGVWSDPVTRTVTVEPNRAAATDPVPAGPGG